MKAKVKLKLLYLFLAALGGFLLLLLSYLRVFDEFEYSMLDLRYRLRPARTVLPEIVIIEVGDDSIEKIGKWPFPRTYHAVLVKALKSAGAKDIIFDIFFSEEKEGDADFAAAISEAGDVYMPYVFDIDRGGDTGDRVSASGYAAPLIDPLAKAAKSTGFINVEPDPDGKVRRIPAIIWHEGRFYPHMTVLAALDRLGYSFDDVEIVPGRYLMAGDMRIPLDERSSILVDYPDKWGKGFRHYSYVDIIQSYLAGITGDEATLDLQKEVGGAVCFIGLTATASPDAHPSPMEAVYPGIGVHTSVYNSIVKGRHLERVTRWWNLMVLIILAVITGWVTMKAGKRFAIISITLVMLGYSAVSYFLFQIFGLWIDVFYPLITVVVIYVALSFKKYVAETRKREVLEKELNIARDIQRSFLPTKEPADTGLDIAARMYTANQVGGDLYDLISLDDGKAGIMIGDVSGKGVPAALFMARVVSVFKTYVHEGSPARIIGLINDRLVKEGGASLFVTLSYAVFDTRERIVRYASGGHLPIIAIKPDGSTSLLDVKEGIPLGLLESDFSEGTFAYVPGTVFLFCTDGVTEAMNTREEMFGQEKLLDTLSGSGNRSAGEIVRIVHDAVSVFEGKAPQHDDITIIAVKA